MSDIEWQRLMRLGLCQLRLPPETFWSLTPVELMLMASEDADGAPMRADGLGDLMRRFPDDKEAGDARY